MGSRLLALLAVTSLGAGSAVVGLSMASGSWNVLGVGLGPGEGYALQLEGGADRIRLELTNLTENPVASFSVYAPNGERAGYYVLNGDTRSAELVAGQGIWSVFVYKAAGADLTVSFHGQDEAASMRPALVERREVQLAHASSNQPIDATYTAVLGQEPVLAGVYVKGSARNFQSELFTEKGPVEVVNEVEVSAVGGVVVDSQGSRHTLPQNLRAGPFTAKVQADGLSGSLLLVSLHLKAPDFLEPMPGEGEDAPPAKQDKRHKHEDKHREHKHAAVKAPRAHGPQFVECGTLDSQVPALLELDRAGMLRLTLEEEVDPTVSVFDPLDNLVAVAVLEEEGDVEVLPVGMPGGWVLYGRGAPVKVEVSGVAECKLVALETEAVGIAGWAGVALLLVGTDQAMDAEVALERAPLEFGVRLSPETVAQGLRATFTGPEGEAAWLESGFRVGLFEAFGHRSAEAEADMTKMLPGGWMVHMEADLLEGQVEALALHYLRPGAEDDGDDDADDGR